jgi:hypothetical protein
VAYLTRLIVRSGELLRVDHEVGRAVEVGDVGGLLALGDCGALA